MMCCRSHFNAKELIELIAEQQKLILIADLSELGWSVVAQYNAEELADDSENETKNWQMIMKTSSRCQAFNACSTRRLCIGAQADLPGPCTRMSPALDRVRLQNLQWRYRELILMLLLIAHIKFSESSDGWYYR